MKNIKNYVEINKETYDKVANDLKKRHNYLGINEPTPKDYYSKIMKYINKKENLKYLELGPGDGNVLKYFSKKNIESYAIEISDKMIELCKENSPKTKIINENILNVDFEVEKFDIIFAGSFIHLFFQSDLDIIMKKIYKWLNDDGVFFAYTTLHEVDEEGYFSKKKDIYKEENVRFRRHFTRKSLEELFKKYKFQIQEHYEIEEPESNRIWQFIIVTKEN